MKVSVPFPLSITSNKCCGRINAPRGGTRIPYMVHNMSGHKKCLHKKCKLAARICWNMYDRHCKHSDYFWIVRHFARGFLFFAHFFS